MRAVGTSILANTRAPTGRSPQRKPFAAALLRKIPSKIHWISHTNAVIVNEAAIKLARRETYPDQTLFSLSRTTVSMRYLTNINNFILLYVLIIGDATLLAYNRNAQLVFCIQLPLSCLASDLVSVEISPLGYSGHLLLSECQLDEVVFRNGFDANSHWELFRVLGHLNRLLIGF